MYHVTSGFRPPDKTPNTNIYQYLPQWQRVGVFFLWRNSPAGVYVAPFWKFLDPTQTQIGGMAFWLNDKPVAKAATYTTRNKHNRRKSMPSASFEPAIAEIKRL